MELPLKRILTTNWGPTEDALPSFSGLPFTPFSKADPINYIANWDPNTTRTTRRRHQNTFGNDMDAVGLGRFDDDDNINDIKDDDGFITVNRMDYKSKQPKWKRDTTAQQIKLQQSHQKIAGKEQKKRANAPKQAKKSRNKRMKNKKYTKYIENPRPKIPSIKKQDHWIDINEIWFRDTFESDDNDKIGSIQTPRNKKLLFAGSLHGVLTKYDSIHGNVHKSETLDYERFNDFKYKQFNYKSAIQDPYILELATKSRHSANIFTTDNVLSAIMCCTRSKYSFDIVINKIGDKIFLDERNKVLSNCSVDETSQNRPTQKGTSKINKYTSLAEEATYINHVFAEQMVYHSKLEYIQKLKRRHPFIDEIKRRQNKMDQEVASQAFSYNLFEVTDDISVLCRCGIDGYIINTNNKKSTYQRHKDWVKIYALNQYDSNRSKTTNWRKYLYTRDATILSQEITNNNFKCARWGICAHLSDAKYIKLGFIERSNVHSIEGHSIIGVKTYDTFDFIKNKLGIRSMNEPWRIFAKFIKCIKAIDGDGRFIAIRDPLRQKFNLFKVSDDAFVKDDGLPSFGYLRRTIS